MCVQTRSYYLCGCLQSTYTGACRGSLGAAKRGQPHNVTVTDTSLDEPCPWGCKNSATVTEVGGRLEKNLEKKTVVTIQPPPHFPCFEGTSSPGGTDKVEEYNPIDAAVGGTDEPSPGDKFVVMKLCYPSDLHCFTIEINTEDAREISVVMKHRHSENSPSRASALSGGTTSVVKKKRAPRAKAIKPKTTRPKKTEKTKLATTSETAQPHVPDLTTADARKISLAMQRRPSESNSSRVMQRRQSENNPSWTSGLSKGTYAGVKKERASRAKSV